MWVSDSHRKQTTWCTCWHQQLQGHFPWVSHQRQLNQQLNLLLWVAPHAASSKAMAQHLPWPCCPQKRRGKLALLNNALPLCDLPFPLLSQLPSSDLLTKSVSCCGRCAHHPATWKLRAAIFFLPVPTSLIPVLLPKIYREGWKV